MTNKTELPQQFIRNLLSPSGITDKLLQQLYQRDRASLMNVKNYNNLLADLQEQEQKHTAKSFILLSRRVLEEMKETEGRRNYNYTKCYTRYMQAVTELREKYDGQVGLPFTTLEKLINLSAKVKLPAEEFHFFYGIEIDRTKRFNFYNKHLYYVLQEDTFDGLSKEVALKAVLEYLDDVFSIILEIEQGSEINKIDDNLIDKKESKPTDFVGEPYYSLPYRMFGENEYDAGNMTVRLDLAFFNALDLYTKLNGLAFFINRQNLDLPTELELEGYKHQFPYELPKTPTELFKEVYNSEVDLDEDAKTFTNHIYKINHYFLAYLLWLDEVSQIVNVHHKIN